MPLTEPVVLTGTIVGAYAQKFKVQGVDGDVDLFSILQFLTQNAGGGGGDVIYVQGDWVIKGSEGIETGVSLPGTHTVTVPEGKSLSSLQTRITDPLTDLDEDGNMRVNIAWNTSEYNQNIITAFTPFVFFMDNAGNQFTAAELGVPITNAVASGLTSTSIGINNVLPTPFTVKLIF